MNNQSNWKLIFTIFILGILLNLISVCIFCIVGIFKKRFTKDKEFNNMLKIFGEKTISTENSKTQI